MNVRLIYVALISIMLAACGGGGGSSTSSGPVPAAPTGVTAVAKDGYVLLDAAASTDPTITGYNIYWSTSPGVSKSSPNKFAVGSSPQAHTGLTNGTTYYYVITAVNASGESAVSAEVSATPVAAATVTDPLYVDQWNLQNTGQLGATNVAGKAGEDINVSPAWPTTKGAGVRIAIVDDGLEMAHEDLASNVGANGTSHNYVTGTSDPTNDPADTTSGHGTECAGIAAARDSNGLGGSGVAPRATLVGYNLLQNQTTSNEVDAMTRNASSVSVSSNSWGAPDGTGELAAAPTTWQSAINTGLTTGRGGKGTVYTWAAGNGAMPGNTTCDATMGFSCIDNSNYDGQANYRGVMAVAAVNDQGVQSSYSESGANLWVAAPGGEFCDTHTITTVDRTGAVGHNTAATASVTDYANQNYTKCMNGTSSATPTVAGVVALMLAANPNLGWRDVRIILAQTARVNDVGTCTSGTTPCTSTSTGWISNGFGYAYNHKYGFGVVNAASAVTAAQGWANVGPEVTYNTPLSSPNAVITDSATANVAGPPTTSTISVPASTTTGISNLEWVAVTVTITAPPGTNAGTYYSGDYDITLTSPAGTVSQLAVPHSCGADQFGACSSTYSGWVFGSAVQLGEAAAGTWMLSVKDGLTGGGNGTLNSWSLKFYGS